MELLNGEETEAFDTACRDAGCAVQRWRSGVRSLCRAGFGWDIDTAYSTPRGMIIPIGSFGHTGFTGTTLWMDPGSDTYVILLANAIHPRGNPPISNLRGEVATATAQALRLYRSASSATTSTPARRTPR